MRKLAILNFNLSLAKFKIDLEELNDEFLLSEIDNFEFGNIFEECIETFNDFTKILMKANISVTNSLS